MTISECFCVLKIIIIICFGEDDDGDESGTSNVERPVQQFLVGLFKF